MPIDFMSPLSLLLGRRIQVYSPARAFVLIGMLNGANGHRDSVSKPIVTTRELPRTNFLGRVSMFHQLKLRS